MRLTRVGAPFVTAGMLRSRCHIWLLVLSASLCGAGCAPFMQPYDEMAVWLDRYPFALEEPAAKPRHRVARQPRPPRVQLVQHEAELPSPAAEPAPGEPRAESVPVGPEDELPPDLTAEGPQLVEAGSSEAMFETAAPRLHSHAHGASSSDHVARAPHGVACGCAVGASCPHCPVECLLGCQGLLEDCPLLHPPPPGPPPVRYQPALPPQFLLVPTEPVLAPGRTGPVELPRGNVRAGFDPQWTIMGRD